MRGKEPVPGLEARRAKNGRAPDPRINPLLAGRMLLGEALENGVEPPEEQEPGILLRGKVHHVFAAAGLGKTMLALWLIKQAILRGEIVVLLDDENGVRTIAERLQEMGVSPKEVDARLFYLPFPSLPMTEEARGNYVDLLDDLKPDLIIFDSWISFLAGAGMNESENTDVQTWCAAYTQPARARGITTVILDHVPHQGSRARGASRKRDEVDVQWQLYRTKHFDRETVGEINLHCEKDRDAWLEPSVRFSVGGTGDGGLVFRRSAGTVEEPDDEGLTPSARKLLDVLRAKFQNFGANASEWAAAANVARQTVYRSKDALLERGLIEERGKRYFPVPWGDTTPPGPDDSGTAPLPEAGVTLHHESSVTDERGVPKQQTGEVSHVSHSVTSGPGDTGEEGVTLSHTPIGCDSVTPPRTPERSGDNEGASVSGRRLTPDEVERVKRLVREGMSPTIARAEVLGEDL